jgi:hypothetical protein
MRDNHIAKLQLVFPRSMRDNHIAKLQLVFQEVTLQNILRGSLYETGRKRERVSE